MVLKGNSGTLSPTFQRRGCQLTEVMRSMGVMDGSGGGETMAGKINQRTCWGDKKPNFLVYLKNRKFCSPPPEKWMANSCLAIHADIACWLSASVPLSLVLPLVFPRPECLIPHRSGSLAARCPRRWRCGRGCLPAVVPAHRQGGRRWLWYLASVSQCLVMITWVTDSSHGGGSINNSLDPWMAMWWCVGVSLTSTVPLEPSCLLPLKLPSAASNHGFVGT